MFVVETFRTGGGSRDRRCFDNSGPIRIEINQYGDMNVLTVEKFCKTCNGSGGIQYWYACDEVVGAKCPVCNGGQEKKWEREKKQWANHSH